MKLREIFKDSETIIQINADGTVYHRGELVSKKMLMSAIMECHAQLINELDNLKSREENKGD